jgi:mRNA-degrading endonuclease toxin of MazEF toxin-antitoxin module
VKTQVGGKDGVAAIDQIRTVDKRRLIKKIDVVPEKTEKRLLESVGELFAL